MAEPLLYNVTERPLELIAGPVISAPFQPAETQEAQEAQEAPDVISISGPCMYGDCAAREANICFSPHPAPVHVPQSNPGPPLCFETLTPVYKTEKRFVSSSSKRVLFSPMYGLLL